MPVGETLVPANFSILNKHYNFAGAFKDIRPHNWCLSEKYKTYLHQSPDDLTWIPDHDYYIHMVSRLVNSILPAKLSHVLPAKLSLVLAAKLSFVLPAC